MAYIDDTIVDKIKVSQQEESSSKKFNLMIEIFSKGINDLHTTGGPAVINKANKNLDNVLDSDFKAKATQSGVGILNPQIAQNKVDIAQNKVDISQNKVDIVNNRTDISQNLTDIKANNNGMVNNSLNISNNTKDIGDNMRSIGTNLTAINKNKTDIGALDTRVITLENRTVDAYTKVESDNKYATKTALTNVGTGFTSTTTTDPILNSARQGVHVDIPETEVFVGKINNHGSISVYDKDKDSYVSINADYGQVTYKKTGGQLTTIGLDQIAINNLTNVPDADFKAKATQSGVGIIDAYTKTESDGKYATKTALTNVGHGFTNTTTPDPVSQLQRDGIHVDIPTAEVFVGKINGHGFFSVYDKDKDSYFGMNADYGEFMYKLSGDTKKFLKLNEIAKTDLSNVTDATFLAKAKAAGVTTTPGIHTLKLADYTTWTALHDTFTNNNGIHTIEDGAGVRYSGGIKEVTNSDLVITGTKTDISSLKPIEFGQWVIKHGTIVVEEVTNNRVEIGKQAGEVHIGSQASKLFIGSLSNGLELGSRDYNSVFPGRAVATDDDFKLVTPTTEATVADVINVAYDYKNGNIGGGAGDPDKMFTSGDLKKRKVQYQNTGSEIVLNVDTPESNLTVKSDDGTVIQLRASNDTPNLVYSSSKGGVILDVRNLLHADYSTATEGQVPTMEAGKLVMKTPTGGGGAGNSYTKAEADHKFALQSSFTFLHGELTTLLIKTKDNELAIDKHHGLEYKALKNDLADNYYTKTEADAKYALKTSTLSSKSGGGWNAIDQLTYTFNVDEIGKKVRITFDDGVVVGYLSQRHGTRFSITVIEGQMDEYLYWANSGGNDPAILRSFKLTDGAHKKDFAITKFEMEA